MTYAAIAYNVMVASPSDVEVQRAIVRDEVYMWNAIHSRPSGIVLLPTGWETHTSPEMGDRPQGIINRQLLERCDLLVAVFGARLGTETGRYESGTVEEIEEHVGKGKPAMLYFSTSIGDTSNFDVAQFQRLQAFQKRCRQTGLYETFGSDGEFRSKFARQLQLKVNDHAMFKDRSGPVVDASPKASDDRRGGESDRHPMLSEKALVLLKQAANDPSGYVMVISTLEGDTYQVNNETINLSFERREVALWDEAIEQLANERLVRQKSTSGKGLRLYEMTSRGYTMADLIDPETKQWKA